MSRFRPARLGLISVAEYLDETFAFAGGRLVLQGHNGAGKSKALELSIPLLFSGETRPRQLDTFGSASKRLKDVVLWTESAKMHFPQRTGWVWLELERDSRHVTIGAGMHAHRDWSDVRTKFFVLDGPRVGMDVHLLLPDRNPVTFPHIKEALGEPPRARIFDSARDFRAAQDELLFGFGDEDRYGVMLRLLLALRRPNLSENMNPDTVGELLTQTLPPIDAGLIGRIGTLLEELERIGAEQRETGRAADTVRAVHDEYAQFAAAVACERAGALRTAADVHGAAAKRLERARAEQGRLLAELERARNERSDAQRATDGAGARLGELRRSPEARSARALEERATTTRRARETADVLADAATESAEAAEAARVEAGAADREAGASAEALRSAVDVAASEARAAGVEGHPAAVGDPLSADGPDPRGLAGALRALGAERSSAAREQRRLDAIVTSAHAERDHRADTRDGLAEEVRAAGERRAELDAQAEVAAQAHAEAIDTWAATASRVVASEADRDELRTLALRDGADGRPAWSRATALAAAARARLAELAGGEEERARALDAEAAGVRADHAALAAAPAPAVPAPHWRAANARDGAASAPLWQLVDFRTEFEDTAQRGGLEGALEGSGLLDALVDAEGGAWRDGDLLLVPAPLTAGATLADALRPDPACDVATAARIEALLRSVALSADPLSSGGPACAPDGRFSFGPARGCNAQAGPRLVGAAARERHRAAQLAELAQRLAALERAAAEHRAERDRHVEGQVAIERELAAYPDAGALLAAMRGALRAADRERDARGRLAAAQARFETADAALRQASEIATGHRSSHGLPADLDALEEALREYALAADRLATAAGAARVARQRAEAVRSRAGQARQRAEAAARRAADQRREADALAEALREAQAVAGDGPARVLERIATLEGEERAARDRAAALSADVERLAERKGGVEEASRGAEQALADTGAELAGREDGLRALAAPDFLRLSLAGDTPEDADQPAAWSSKRCGQLAALVLERARRPEESRAQLAGRVDAGYQQLREVLNTHRRLQVFMERTDDELPALGARVDGRPQTFVQLAAWMDDEVVRLRSLLDERQARLLSEHLAEDVAEHLHDRIFKARLWVRQAAETTERCRTSSGMGVALRFREREDEHPGVRRAVSLLGKPPSLLSEQERSELVAFLFDRIDRARDGDQAESLERVLAQALDYRTWFRFDLAVRMPDGTLKPFTRKRKEIGSGGEREVLLHLPLLAAAAAIYDAAAPHCPRLIALDEAFNKVDETGERGLLDVIVSLELDFLLCGYDLWCAHPEVPAVEIYHLKRWDDHFGVVPLHRFRWNGERTVALDPLTGDEAVA